MSFFLIYYIYFLKINDSKFFIRGYVGIHTTSFKDFLLREELRKSIASSGFEHPSEGKIIFLSFQSNNNACPNH